MKEGSYYDVVSSKMVDHGIALHPEDSGSLDNSMRRALAHLPTQTHHFNQIAYDPVRFAANVVSIETKTGPNGLQDARLQIGIRIASWNLRMHRLLDERQRREKNETNALEDRNDAGKPRALILVPVIIVTEHEWKLYFACDRGYKIEIIGDMAMGDTKSLHGFIIVAVLRRLATWVQSDFHSWLEEALS